MRYTVHVFFNAMLVLQSSMLLCQLNRPFFDPVDLAEAGSGRILMPPHPVREAVFHFCKNRIKVFPVCQILHLNLSPSLS